MNKIIPFLTLLLIFLFRMEFCNAADGSVYSKKETLYSTKNGSPIGDLWLRIEPKSANANNNEWMLIIGDKGAPFFDSSDEKSLWIFSKKWNAQTFKKEMKNRDYPIEVKELNEFLPFCESGVDFKIREWEEVKKQTSVSFLVNAKTGQKVTLRLVFYTSSLDKKKTTINDEAKVKIEFVIPDPAVIAQQNKTTPVPSPASATSPTQEGELITLSEKIDNEAVIQQQKEKQREDSILKAEAANKKQRITLLHSFITDRNKDIQSLQEEVNVLLSDKNSKVEESKIDSLETVVEEMKKKVDFWENGYSDILLTEESIHDLFTKFRITHTTTSKKIDELRQQQVPYHFIISFIKNNILLSLGIGIGGLILLKLLTYLSKKLITALKNKIKKKMDQMKTDAKDKIKQKPQKKSKKKMYDDDFENMDINDLAEI